MKKTHWAILGAALAVCLAVTSVMAQGGRGAKARGGGKGMGAGGGMGLQIPLKLLDNQEFVTAAGLSDAQVSRLKTMLTDSQEKMKSSQTKMKTLRQDLKKLTDADKPDLKAIDKKIDEIGVIQTENMRSMVHLQVNVRSVLTADQIAKAREYVKTKMKQRGGQGGQGGGMGGNMW